MTSYLPYVPKADAFERVKRKKTHFVGAGSTPVELVSPAAQDVERAKASLRSPIKKTKPAKRPRSRSSSDKRKQSPKKRKYRKH